MIETVIRYSHNIAGDDYYSVYVNERTIGVLTTCLSSGYRFEPHRNAPITNFHTFKSLNQAMEQLPTFLIEWLALVALNCTEVVEE